MIELKKLEEEIKKNKEYLYARVLIPDTAHCLYCYNCYSKLIGEVYARVIYLPFLPENDPLWCIDRLLCLRCGKTDRRGTPRIDDIVPEVQEYLETLIRAGKL